MGRLHAGSFVAATQIVASDYPVIAREWMLFDALAEGDAQTLDALLSDDFVLRSSPDVDRDTWIENAVALCWSDRFDPN